MLSLLLLWFHYQDLLMYSTFKPEVEEIIMEDKLPSCINSWGTFVNNNHPLQTEEDAEPLWKDAEPNSQRWTQSPSERTQSPWEDAEPLGGRRVNSVRDTEPFLIFRGGRRAP